MRVAQALVCTDRIRRSVQGLQFSLKDTKTSVYTELEPIGTLHDPSSLCEAFLIDTSTDFLKILTIGFNETGIHGIAFQTYKNQTAAFGRSITDPTLISQLWGITIYDKGP